MESHSNCLAYFDALLDSTYDIQKDAFISEYQPQYNVVSYNVEAGTISYWDFVLDEATGEQSEVIKEVNFRQQFRNKLITELNQTKLCIDTKVISLVSNSNSTLLYVEHLLLRINNLKNSARRKYSEQVMVLMCITELEDFIKRKFLPQDDYSTFEDEPLLQNDNESLEAILGYLKGNNEQRIRIMSEAEYDIMVQNIKQFIETGVVPEYIPKLAKINISNRLLSFTLWVLHRKIIPTRNINADYLRMIKTMFSNFDDQEFSTFKKQFGSKYRVTYGGRNFIPAIIKNELRPE